MAILRERVVSGIMHPYKAQPDSAFWNRTVTPKNLASIGIWYKKKFPISRLRIASAGSCFAQHIGRHLRNNGFNYIDTEPAPNFLAKASHLDFGFGMYSARYGNIYTSRQLLQLLQRALGEFTPEDTYWEKDGGYVDPFRPTIEPEPFSNLDELLMSRRQHLESVRKVFEEADVFIFTLGLTEAWSSVVDGAVFPLAPGVAGGVYDAASYRLINLGFKDVLGDMTEFMKRARQINAKMKFILTVSPVPLMATATKNNVIIANSYSKSVLRAVAGQLADNRPYVDYFPSYEMINSHVLQGQFYEQDMRAVKDDGVLYVMQNFFSEHPAPVLKQPRADAGELDKGDEEVLCDEELLSTFGGSP